MSFIDTKNCRRFGPEKLQKVNLFESPQMFCDVYCLEPGQSQKVHAHSGAAKFYYVIEGAATVTVGDEVRELSPGNLAYALADEMHGVENKSSQRVVLLVAMAPNPNILSHA
ncbi:hypothetical protein B7486_12735 [cyanobacterium TDX16]|nr:hypothetical protein B7486_12735 [cyanobacterium TDX16]